eukprot:6733928-Prymnesium_polylepis.1
MALAATALTRALRVPLSPFLAEGGAPKFFHARNGRQRRCRFFITFEVNEGRATTLILRPHWLHTSLLGPCGPR